MYINVYNVKCAAFMSGRWNFAAGNICFILTRGVTRVPKVETKQRCFKVSMF